MPKRTIPLLPPLNDRQRRPLLVRFLRPRPLPLPVYVLVAVVFLVLFAVQVFAPSPASAASRGAGFGTWAPISTYGWHGSMIVDGVHTYCITPGAPAPTGPSTDNGVSGSAVGLSPQQLTGINLLVTKYGQTDDPVQAASVGWAVKAIANWQETLHAFGYPGDSLAGAIHWTFSALAPEHDLAVQERAVAFYDEAMSMSAGAASASGAMVFTTDAADPRVGTVRVDATVAAATGSLTLVNATFVDTGSATRENAAPGVDYAILATPPEPGRAYTVSGTGRFSVGYTAAVRHYSTPGGQDTAGPAGELWFDVAGADAAPRVPPFTPTITTNVAARYAAGGPYVDDITVSVEDGSWPRGDDGGFLPLTAHATVYRTDVEPAPGPLPEGAEAAGELALIADAGPESIYRVTSDWEMAAPGFYTAVWTIRGADQSEAVAAHTGHEYVWIEQFGERTQVTLVPAIATVAQPVAATGETLSDTVNVTGGVPSDGLQITSALYRAVEGMVPAETCVPENLVWESSAVPVTEPGSYVVTSPPVTEPGTYYWQERAVDAAGDLVHLGVCGIENETSRVVAPAPHEEEQPEPAAAGLAASGLVSDAVRGPAAIAIGLLTLGATIVATRRATPHRFGARPGIR